MKLTHLIGRVKTIAILALSATTGYFFAESKDLQRPVNNTAIKHAKIGHNDTLIIPQVTVKSNVSTATALPAAVILPKRLAADIDREISRGAAAVMGPLSSAPQTIDSLQRVIAAYQRRQSDAVDPTTVRLMRDTINSQRRQLAIARSIPPLFKDRNVSVPVFLPALDGDTSHPLIDLAGLRFNTELSLMDSTYQRNPFYEKQYYTVLKTEDIARATISGKGSLVLKREQPKLGFRVQALTTYSIWRRSFSLGIGTRIDYGNRFNAGVNAIINPFTGIPEISIYAKEDIAQWGR